MKFPWVDLVSKKIYNCEKNSFHYFHEEGHLKYAEQEFAGRLQLFQRYAFLFWMLSITLGMVNKYMLFLSLPCMIFYIGVDIYEEYWCNSYAYDAMARFK